MTEPSPAMPSDDARRPRVVAGNWKMHHGPVAARDFLADLAIDATVPGPRVIVFPPAVSLSEAARHAPAGVEIGAQNIHWEDEGAFTGELSAPLAREAGATLTLIGHSERRHLFGETDDQVARKVGAALRNGLMPVVCVGETLDERRAGRVEAVILRQLDAALDLIGPDDPFLLAYEPVWAIGTGETATPTDASAAHGALRVRVAAWNSDRAAALPILYGGSVKPANAAELMTAPDVDGVLVGGASLDPGSFAAIVAAGR